MLYQKLLPASSPYVIYTSSTQGSFPIHKHHEIELIYSPRDTVVHLTLSDNEYDIKGGELAVIGTLAPHGIDIKRTNPDVMVLELGPIFLKEHFHSMSGLDLSAPIIDLSADDETTCDLKRCLNEIYNMYKSAVKKDELLIIGNIYRICSNIIKLKSAYIAHKIKAESQKLKKSLDYIHTNYTQKITLDETASMVGYSKGNFCKAFKLATGLSFHAYLNNYRITNACYLLSNTEMSIGSIAEAVGFTEFKTFCRVFRSVIGKTPTEFRCEKAI